MRSTAVGHSKVSALAMRAITRVASISQVALVAVHTENDGRWIAENRLSGASTYSTGRQPKKAATAAISTATSGPGIAFSRRGTNACQASNTQIVKIPIFAAH